MLASNQQDSFAPSHLTATFAGSCPAVPCMPAHEMVPVALKRMRVWVLLLPEAGRACHTMASVAMSIQQNRCSPSP